MNLIAAKIKNWFKVHFDNCRLTVATDCKSTSAQDMLYLRINTFSIN